MCSIKHKLSHLILTKTVYEKASINIPYGWMRKLNLPKIILVDNWWNWKKILLTTLLGNHGFVVGSGVTYTFFFLLI